MRIVSYNCGLLRFQLCGMELMANPPGADDRIKHILDGILNMHPDIVAFQECYEDQHFQFLAQGLHEIMPYSTRYNSATLLKFHNGLCFFSKFPIVSSRLHAHKEAAFVETIFGSKSMLETTVQLDNGQKIMFVNLHTTAGGGVDPESPGTDGTRQSEIDEALSLCRESISKNIPGFIIGDLNAGPDASPGNYESILKAGFRDMYLEAQEANVLTPGKTCTWDPKNPLNVCGVHWYCPPQRCDHLFVPKGPWKVEKASVVMTETTARTRLKVPLDKEHKKMKVQETAVTPSDHYGLLFDIST
eukprot:m.339573 g.339573  ORF g.339573 m.339573 type:complete len:302 (-) comp18871_c0_seq1:187-1092(-)